MLSAPQANCPVPVQAESGPDSQVCFELTSLDVYVPLYAPDPQA